MKQFSALFLFLYAAVASLAATIHVPANQPTIQAGINAAKNGDRVVVAPGTYYENINFEGKAITVVASSGRTGTIIDGGNAGSVVTFNSGEGLNSVLEGFTIQHGSNSDEGGGIYINEASPTITENTITHNTAGNGGGGIAVDFSDALVKNNLITNNSQTLGSSGGVGGGGIEVGGAGAAQIIGNTIQNNQWATAEGGGIALFAAGTPTLKNNIISGNSAYSQGGGIWIVNYSDALIVQNLIYNNTAIQGSGIYFGVPEGYRGPLLVNNTIVGSSDSSEGSAIYADGFDDQVQFYNNLLIGATGSNAVYCDSTYDATPPTFTNNDAYSANGSGLEGTCSGQSSTNGNISANPLFTAKLNFRLKAGSPAIDAGDNSAPDIPPLDLAGKPRIVDGNGGGTAIIDVGAYEYQPPASSSIIPDQH
jgi:parallel beta-helix repeat protein